MRRAEEAAKKAGFRTSKGPTDPAEAESIAAADRERAKELLKEAGCPIRQLTAERPLRTDGTAKGWGEKLEEMAARLGTGFLIAFIGSRGPGKTQMGVELIRLATSGLMSAKYATAMEFFIAVKGAYRDDSGSPSEAIVIGQFTRPRLLVLDEIQERGATAWENRLLTHLVDVRYREMRDTILIGNLEKESLRTELGPSIVSRLIEAGGIVEFNWDTFRQPRAVAKKKGGK